VISLSPLPPGESRAGPPAHALVLASLPPSSPAPAVAAAAVHPARSSPRSPGPAAVPGPGPLRPVPVGRPDMGAAPPGRPFCPSGSSSLPRQPGICFGPIGSEINSQVGPRPRGPGGWRSGCRQGKPPPNLGLCFRPCGSEIHPWLPRTPGRPAQAGSRWPSRLASAGGFADRGPGPGLRMGGRPAGAARVRLAVRSGNQGKLPDAGSEGLSQVVSAAARAFPAPDVGGRPAGAALGSARGRRVRPVVGAAPTSV